MICQLTASLSTSGRWMPRSACGRKKSHWRNDAVQGCHDPPAASLGGHSPVVAETKVPQAGPSRGELQRWTRTGQRRAASVLAARPRRRPRGSQLGRRPRRGEQARVVRGCAGLRCGGGQPGRGLSTRTGRGGGRSQRSATVAAYVPCACRRRSPAEPAAPEDLPPKGTARVAARSPRRSRGPRPRGRLPALSPRPLPQAQPRLPSEASSRPSPQHLSPAAAQGPVVACRALRAPTRSRPLVSATAAIQGPAAAAAQSSL